MLLIFYLWRGLCGAELDKLGLFLMLVLTLIQVLCLVLHRVYVLFPDMLQLHLEH